MIRIRASVLCREIDTCCIQTVSDTLLVPTKETILQNHKVRVLVLPMGMLNQTMDGLISTFVGVAVKKACKCVPIRANRKSDRKLRDYDKPKRTFAVSVNSKACWLLPTQAYVIRSSLSLRYISSL